MHPKTDLLTAQQPRWPSSGRHIMASFDDESIVVYQAYAPSIGRAAIADQAFGGGGFSFSRMSWVKPNFLWMMYRSGWASKPAQEMVLAVRIERALFDAILADAVHSTYVPAVYGDQAAWKAALQTSQVRLQWDPDHGPSGAKLERRAIQLGLRGDRLRTYATRPISIVDMTPFVADQRGLRGTHALRVPIERPYPVDDPAVRAHLGLATDR